jgi:hypothetical protein
MGAFADRTPEGRAVVDVVDRLIGRASLAGRPGASSPALLEEEEAVLIHFAGCEFLTRISMAKIFLHRLEAVIAEDGSELVPLLHVGGIEMLAVTRFMPISVSEVAPGMRIGDALGAL